MLGFKKLNDSNSDILSESQISNLEEKEEESKYIFERALEKYINNQYKQTISYIDSVQLNDQTSLYWQVIYLKLSSYQKIIENKLKKYYNSNIT